MAETDVNRKCVGRADLRRNAPWFRRAAFRPSGTEPLLPLLSPRLLALVLAGSILCPLSASAAGSVLRVGSDPSSGAAGSSTVSTGLRGAPADPAACARDFHAKLKPIAEGPFQGVKAALSAPSEPARTAAPGEAPAARGLIFPPNARSRGPNESAALRAATAAANGASGVAPRDGNARWTAMRVREDLADFLTQGPSPYLCSGIDQYLATLKRFAGQVAISPERRQRDLETARAMARSSLDAALLALRPVPLPTPAPEDRSTPAEIAETLRASIGVKDEAFIGPPMLVAGREEGETRISQGNAPDPDLPPIPARAENKLESDADVSAAVAELAQAIRRRMPNVAESQALDTTTTGSVVAPIGPMRPAPAKDTPAKDGAPKDALTRLAELKPLFAPEGGFPGDARTRLTVVGALSDLEVTDRLLGASSLPADPLGAAFTATFDAIAAAHAESCRCKP